MLTCLLLLIVTPAILLVPAPVPAQEFELVRSDPLEDSVAKAYEDSVTKVYQDRLAVSRTARRIHLPVKLDNNMVTRDNGIVMAKPLDELEKEEKIRNRLRRLGRWKVKQLLYTESQVDNKQKARANKSTNGAELSVLAEDEDSGVRFYVAANRHTPVGVLWLLAGDSVPLVRSGVALNLKMQPLASKEVRDLIEKMAFRLASDRLPLVRLVLAANELIPEAVFDSLALDGDPVVRQKLTQNIYATESALQVLAADSVLTVKLGALKHRNAPVAALDSASHDVPTPIRQAVAMNINTPFEILERLANDSETEIRQAVAEHPQTPLETLRQLSQDEKVEVVVAVANHPRSDRDLLEKLSFDDRDPTIRLAAQTRIEPLLRREIRDDVLERWE